MVALVTRGKPPATAIPYETKVKSPVIIAMFLNLMLRRPVTRLSCAPLSDDTARAVANTDRLLSHINHLLRRTSVDCTTSKRPMAALLAGPILAPDHAGSKN